MGEDYDPSTGPAEPAIVDVAVASEIYHNSYAPRRRGSGFWTGPRVALVGIAGLTVLLFFCGVYLIVRTAVKPKAVAREAVATTKMAASEIATVPTTSATQGPGNRALFEALTAGTVAPEQVASAEASTERAKPEEAILEPASSAVAGTTTEPSGRPAVGYRIKPVFPAKNAARRVTDADIERAIRRATDFMVGQFPGKRLRGADNYDPETFAGLDALCVYSMLVAGETTGDPRLDARGDFMKGLLGRLKEFPMEGNKATYSRSLRAAALAVYDRPEDRQQLVADAAWLMRASCQGAYTYSMPPPGTTRPSLGWDNSNSQYGALGVWAAAMAGVDVPAQYWAEVQAHWADCQTFAGGWGYSRGSQAATLAMTAAGVNMMYTSGDQLGGERPQVNAPRKATTSAGLIEVVERGLEWMDEGDHCVQYQGAHPGYTLYGMERAGLASGLKFFGNHDWYRELAEQAVRTQQKDGAWKDGDGIPAETAFHILFLCRGRYPVFMSKLRIGGTPFTHPRDLNYLSRYLDKQLERQFNWQVASLDRDWKDWMDAPVLMVSGTAPIDLQDRDVANLRAYAENGGMIYTQADNGSKPFTVFAKDLAARLFPGRALAPLAEDHPLFTSLAKLEPRPKLLGVSNGARLLMVHSAEDVSGKWPRRVLKENRYPADVGMNLFVYAAGRRDFRNRIESPFVAPPEGEAAGTVRVARVKYEGNWDPEPAAWPRAARVFQTATGIAVEAVPLSPFGLSTFGGNLAHLTGTDAVAFSEGDAAALREWVSAGGTLLIDSAGGSKAFAESVRTALLPKLVRGEALVPLAAAHPLRAGGAEGMRVLAKVRLTDFAAEAYGNKPPPMRIADVGKGHVVVTDLDLTTALLDCRTWGIAGYQPAWAEGFVNNLLLWSLIQDQPLAPPANNR